MRQRNCVRSRYHVVSFCVEMLFQQRNKTVVTMHVKRKVLSNFSGNVTSRLYYFLGVKMESRFKRLVNLALTTENSNIPVAGTSADKGATLSSEDARSNIQEATLNVDEAAKKKADLSISNRNPCGLTSCSNSSSSDSSTSSSSNTSFNEDSDDSVKTLNYEVVQPY